MVKEIKKNKKKNPQIFALNAEIKKIKSR